MNISENKTLLKSNIEGLDLFRSGKVRDIYDLGDRYLFITTDRISVFDVVLNQGIPNKGETLNRLSAFWFDHLKNVRPNHLITADFDVFPDELKRHPEIAGRSMIVKKVERIDIECIVRGYITGSAWNEYQSLDKVDGHVILYGNYVPADLVESARFPEPIFTPSIKADEGHDVNISLEEYYDRAGREIGDKIIGASLELYKQAVEYALPRGYIIADTKFEFGLDGGRLMFIDEALTPDSSRFWRRADYSPGKPQESFDKQYLRDYLKSVGWKGQGPPPDLPPDVIDNTAARYREALKTLIG
jgi:phosphoribosylaminoimidazole-succinocarboxamide synthase